MCIQGLTNLDLVAKVLDAPFGYFSSVAKWTYYWLDTNKSKKVFDRAVLAFGLEVAVKHFKSKPPRPLSGRWGQIFKVEKRMVPFLEELPALPDAGDQRPQAFEHITMNPFAKSETVQGSTWLFQPKARSRADAYTSTQTNKHTS